MRKLLGEIVCLTKSRRTKSHLAIGRVFWQKLGVQAINLSPQERISLPS